MLTDLRRTFAAWRAQPLLPLSVLLFGAAAVLADSSAGLVVILYVPLSLFWIGMLGAHRVLYAAAWEGRRARPGEIFELSLAFFGRYVALGLASVLIALPVAFLLFPVAGREGAQLAGAAFAGAVMTFAPNAVVFDREPVPRAVLTGLQLLRSGLPGSLPYALFPVYMLRTVGYDRVWLLVAIEAAALVVRGLTTSYYLRVSEPRELPRDYGAARDPARYG